MGFVDSAVRLAVHQLLNQQIDIANGSPTVVARANNLGVSGKSLTNWLDATTKHVDLGYDPKLVKTDSTILGKLSDFATVQTRALDIRAAQGPIKPPQASDRAPIAHLCKIVARQKDGELRYGTGFRMTSRLVLTCRHVLPSEMALCESVDFKFPAHVSGSDDGPTIRAVQVFQATREADHARILLGSPTRDRKVETGDWSEPPTDGDESLDFALLEINYDLSENWEVRIEGSREEVGEQNLFKIITQQNKKLPHGSHPLEPHPSEMSAPDLLGKPVHLRLITDDLEERDYGFQVSRVHEQMQRVRYRQERTVQGDSGAPLVEQGDDDRQLVVAIHNAQIDKEGQAVPIGPILRKIAGPQLDPSHKAELASFGWFPTDVAGI